MTDDRTPSLARLRSLSAELRETLNDVLDFCEWYRANREGSPNAMYRRVDEFTKARLSKPDSESVIDALDVEIAQLEEQMQEDLARNRTGEAAPVRPVHAENATSDVPKW